MIKIPATEAGYGAMYELMSCAISVNATLVFSPEQAKNSFTAMTRGISKCEADGGCRVEGVISVFVSRFDRKLDERLREIGIDGGRTGIYMRQKYIIWLSLIVYLIFRNTYFAKGYQGWFKGWASS